MPNVDSRLNDLVLSHHAQMSTQSTRYWRIFSKRRPLVSPNLDPFSEGKSDVYRVIFKQKRIGWVSIARESSNLLRHKFTLEFNAEPPWSYTITKRVIDEVLNKLVMKRARLLVIKSSYDSSLIRSLSRIGFVTEAKLPNVVDYQGSRYDAVFLSYLRK